MCASSTSRETPSQCQRCTPSEGDALTDSLGNGGAERQLALLATHLPEEWQRRVFALGGGAFATHLRDQGVPVSILPRRSRLDPLPAVDLWRSLVASSPDIVHSWGWMSTMAVGPLCRLKGVPLVDGAIRSGVPEGDHPHLRRLGRAFATTIVANSRAGLLASNVTASEGRRGLQRLRLVTPARVLMRPCDSGALPGPAARWAPFHRRHDRAHGAGQGLPYRHRGCSLLGQGNRAWRFILVGDGEDRAQLTAEAADLVDDGIVEYPKPGLEVLRHVRRRTPGF